MSVLIKGIGIPESCAECRFCVNGFTDDAPMYECACESSENVSVLVDDHGKPFDFRPEWCPLIELPPHGRLIDADFEEAHYTSMTVNPTPDVTKQDKRNSLIIIEALQKAKTIIGAEGSET